MATIIKLCIVILASTLLASCITHYDVLSTFAIVAKTTNSTDNAPVTDVAVYFVDTGFDLVRSKDNFKMFISNTDNAGNINKEFSYFWGYETSLMDCQGTNTFGILFEKQGFHPKELHFDSSSLKRNGEVLQINIGAVSLTKSIVPK